MIWHEAIAGRGAAEITSTFVKAIKTERDAQHLIYWMDNCSAQNKNWTLFTAMVVLVNNTENELQDITFKYFQPGHTFMSADSVHHGVEHEIKKQPNGNIYDFKDFCRVVSNSNSGRMLSLYP